MLWLIWICPSREAIAEEQRMAAKFSNDIEIAKAQRDFEMKTALYNQEVQTKKAESDMAYNLQAAKTQQRIKEEKMQIRVKKTFNMKTFVCIIVIIPSFRTIQSCESPVQINMSWYINLTIDWFLKQFTSLYTLCNR